jgi:hypothetical protein
MSVEDKGVSSDATASDGECEMLFCDNGWVEIRNPKATDDQWLMADTCTEVRQ